MSSFTKQNKNKYLEMDGLLLLRNIPANSIDCCFEDFQYRDVLEKLKYGNEGVRQKGRALLKQMDEGLIINFLIDTTRVLKPSAHLFLWVDKFILCEAKHKVWFETINQTYDENASPVMNLVDMITWDKGSIGMGYRSRRKSEHLLVYQKSPKTTKNWTDKGIPDNYLEKIENPRSKVLHPHRKPVELIKRLIKSVVPENGIVLDPCAGSFSTFDACRKTGRDFIGCDLTLEFVDENNR